MITAFCLPIVAPFSLIQLPQQESLRDYVSHTDAVLASFAANNS
ncbi:hypothetical protein Y11_07041 [Yersinia enterocolitica subsp. palearctica Y11]|uniref:Uncharacterized protein n=1 Tax=Yersinia enterocolitica subsp. palearctica serotype O:3 (strain DSM 13030 / CIP 106945 / Y11) TaxID=930944 RepID=A0A0H3NQI0_YERE1|nr:hypothetical protein Y11_07041 [Yersinia enterocolitica subsp. palearctica Y11]CCO68892.1 hypothetical protein D322_2018 [Yersinia enterocolitica IP 10393]